MRLKALGESRSAASVAVFAALHVILDSIPVYPFREWAVYLEPLEGMILGPRLGVLTAVVGGSISRAVIGANIFSFVYGVTGEAVGVATAGLLIKGRWRIVAALYAFMLAAYFTHPYGLMLPLWAVLDCMVAFALIYPAAVLNRNIFEKRMEVRRFALTVLLISFISTVAHSLTMVFILVPAGMYMVELGTFEAVYYAFVIGAAGSYLEDVIVLAVSIAVYSPLLLLLRRSKILAFPLS
jgi:hypothetical protein